MDTILTTERLTLRPFNADDAPAVQELADNWNVARMTSRMPHPYTRDQAEIWIASHESARTEGIEYVFCLDRDKSVIGAAGLVQKDGKVWELGYWIGEPWWGRGFATEAAARLVRFAFHDLGAVRVTAGHYLDNPASGRVLEKCGFVYSGEEPQACVARGCEVASCRLEIVDQGAAKDRPRQVKSQ